MEDRDHDVGNLRHLDFRLTDTNSFDNEGRESLLGEQIKDSTYTPGQSP
jgi:hypothetical protein